MYYIKMVLSCKFTTVRIIANKHVSKSSFSVMNQPPPMDKDVYSFCMTFYPIFYFLKRNLHTVFSYIYFYIYSTFFSDSVFKVKFYLSL